MPVSSDRNAIISFLVRLVDLGFLCRVVFLSRSHGRPIFQVRIGPLTGFSAAMVANKSPINDAGGSQSKLARADTATSRLVCATYIVRQKLW
jgi:hypothetical protein